METKGRKIMIRKLALTLTMAASLLMSGVSFAHEHEGGEKHEKHEKHEMAAPKVGEMAPAFTAKDINGETVSLADLKGKTVEKLGLIGKEKAIACEVIISITKYD